MVKNRFNTLKKKKRATHSRSKTTVSYYNSPKISIASQVPPKDQWQVEEIEKLKHLISNPDKIIEEKKEVQNQPLPQVEDDIYVHTPKCTPSALNVKSQNQAPAGKFVLCKVEI